MYIQVNIGRNVGPAPMSDDSWFRFKSEVRAAIVMATWGHPTEAFDILDVHNAIQVHEGLGEWDGIPEVSAHISLYSERGINEDRLKSEIGIIRDKYMQDSIAVIVTLDSELV